MGRRSAVHQEILESSSDCILMIDQDLQVVNANEPATRVFTGPTQRARQLQHIAIDWLITDVVDRFGRFGETLGAFLESEAATCEQQLDVVARRLDGMKFRANVRIVPTEEHPKVSHILYLQEAYQGAAF